jgi:predicted TPR repeat methyltransferase
MVAGSARVLQAGGRFAFTVQSHPGDGLILGTDARYAHGDALVRETLAAAGLDLERAEPAVVRRENGADVPGRVIVARQRSRSRVRCTP